MVMVTVEWSLVRPPPPISSLARDGITNVQALRAATKFRHSSTMSLFLRCLCCVGLVALVSFTTTARAQNDAVSRREAIEAMYPIMLGALEAKNFGRARNICDQAIMWEPQNPVHHYNLACIEAQAGGPRLPYAWGALDLAIALGFNDPEHLQNDPDLAPLHSNPKFADLVRKVTFNISAGAAIAGVRIPERPPSSAQGRPVLEPEQPDAPGFKNELPIGLYFMTRYVPSTQALEKVVWYFAADGTAYRGLDRGFSKADLATVGLHGKLSRAGRDLEIIWSDGKKDKAALERDGAGFNWDMGIFVPVSELENSNELPGVYECLESFDPGNSPPVALRLELRADGTFVWEGASILADNDRAKLKSGMSEMSTGQWALSGYSLTLKNSEGVTLRRFVFPDDDDKTVIKPDRVFFAGLMFKRRP
jgi:hypothetical protein